MNTKMNRKLFPILFLCAVSSGCSTTSPAGKLEQFTIDDARQASTLAAKNNRPAAKSCYDSIVSVLTSIGTPSDKTGLLYANEVSAQLDVGYSTIKAACVGTLILP